MPEQKKPDVINIILMIALGVIIIGLVAWAATRSKPVTQTAEMPTQEQQPAQPQPQPALPVAPTAQELDAIPRVTAEELKAKLADGSAIVLDVRAQDAYIAGHIPGALQIPIEFVQGEIPWFPKDKLIVSYCT